MPRDLNSKQRISERQLTQWSLCAAPYPETTYIICLIRRPRDWVPLCLDVCTLVGLPAMHGDLSQYKVHQTTFITAITNIMAYNADIRVEWEKVRHPASPQTKDIHRGDDDECRCRHASWKAAMPHIQPLTTVKNECTTSTAADLFSVAAAGWPLTRGCCSSWR